MYIQYLVGPLARGQHRTEECYLVVPSLRPMAGPSSVARSVWPGLQVTFEKGQRRSDHLE